MYIVVIYTSNFDAKDESQMEIDPREPQGWGKIYEFVLINIF